MVNNINYFFLNFRARLYSEDGHLFIVGGVHSNITLKTSGNGFININDHDLLHITELVRAFFDFSFCSYPAKLYYLCLQIAYSYGYIYLQSIVRFEKDLLTFPLSSDVNKLIIICNNRGFPKQGRMS